MIKYNMALHPKSFQFLSDSFEVTQVFTASFKGAVCFLLSLIPGSSITEACDLCEPSEVVLSTVSLGDQIELGETGYKFYHMFNLMEHIHVISCNHALPKLNTIKYEQQHNSAFRLFFFLNEMRNISQN